MPRWPIAVLVLLLVCRTSHAQSRLVQIRDETRSHTDLSPTPASPSAGRGIDWGDLLNVDPRAWLGGALVVGVVGSSPFWLPGLLLNDNYKTPAAFPAHPYGIEDTPYLRISDRPLDNEEKEWLDPDFLKPWAVQLSLEDGNNLDRFNRLGGRLFIDTTSRFGLSTRWDSLAEHIAGGHVDDSLLGDGYLTFRLAQCSWAQVHVGAGARWLIDSHRKTAGFSALYGADFFPIDPLIVSTSIDLGNLGAAFAIRGRVTVGVHVGRWELFGGYDYQRIGNAQIQGPLAGIRLWF